MTTYAQISHMKRSMETIYDIIPLDQQDKYHILMGRQIIGTYDTLEDMTKAANEEFKYIACLKYIPKSSR